MSTSLASRSNQHSARQATAGQATVRQYSNARREVSLSEVWGATWASASAFKTQKSGSRTESNRRRVRVSSYDSRRPHTDQPRHLSAAAHANPSRSSRGTSGHVTRNPHSYAHDVGALSTRAVIGGIVAIGLFFGGLGAMVFEDSPAESLPRPTYVSFSDLAGQ